MTTCQPNVVEVVKPSAELRLDERVGRWLHLSSHTVRLEAIDASVGKVNVVPPPGNHWVPRNGGARDPIRGQAFLEGFPSLGIGELLLTLLEESIIDESVSAHTIAVSTGVPLLSGSPIEVVTLGTLVPLESQFSQGLSGIELVRICSELRSGQLLHLLEVRALPWS